MVISGDDDLALGVALAGGSGVISVIGQAFPREFSTMINHGLETEITSCKKHQLRMRCCSCQLGYGTQRMVEHLLIYSK